MPKWMSATVIALSCAVPLPLIAQDTVGFDRSSFGKVVLSRNQSAGMELELSIGSYNNEPILNYSTDSIFSRMGRSVGRLDILTDNGVFPCTAFIVDEKYILTNNHCVPGILENEKAGATRIDAVQFVAGYVNQGVETGTKTYIVSPTPVETDKDLDYSVLEVIGNPSAEWGKLALTGRDAHDGDPFWVIGHPMGEAQRISREKCRANAPALTDNQLLHTCDTLPGNSGSPLIDASVQMVVGLHHAGSSKDSVNFAIPMKLILAKSKFLKVSGDPVIRDTSAPTNVTPPSSGPGVQVDETSSPDVCDSLYAEAKAYNACFAYKAYSQSCKSHPYVGFATAYVRENCNTKTTTNPEPPIDTAVNNPPVYTPPTNNPPATNPPVYNPPANNPPVYTPPANNPPVYNPPSNTGLLRPWCGSSRLNSTERAICSDAYLAGLDAQLDEAYKNSRKNSKEQRDWLKNQRNACGGNSNCIGNAVSQRIAVLKGQGSYAPTPEYGQGQSLTLPDGQCYIVVASRASISEAKQFIRDRISDTTNVRVFLSDNGYYGITVATVDRAQADYLLSSWKSQNRIPGDSYCSSGNRYTQEIGWSSSSNNTTNTGTTQLYVDNNNDGGLNLRSGPGTGYGILTEMEVGLQLTEIAKQGTWSQLRLPNGTQGWAATSYLTRYRPQVKVCNGNVVGLQPAANYNRSIGNTYLSVRSGPSTSSGEITEIYQGDVVKVVAQRNGWARVQCVSGQCRSPYRGSANAIGWASAKYLNIRC